MQTFRNTFKTINCTQCWQCLLKPLRRLHKQKRQYYCCISFFRIMRRIIRIRLVYWRYAKTRGCDIVYYGMSYVYKLGLHVLFELNICFIILNYCMILTALCVRSDLGRELAKSDSFLRHTFSFVVSFIFIRSEHTCLR